ncbi:hypothetical protein EW026_g4131 [Hermanssonia centrifuga]|uniref:Cytochrome P450 n=1 Tax=Hermanssonia centrifuga TaxID=98765 RepID=A0A4S4KI45_9APHY|nr:hypothetical protein EW026_g4131 [Hermanssonia centrifuga]
MLQEGYDKYKGGMFKIPLPDRWIVVVTGSRLVDDLQKFPDDHVSFLEAAADLTHINHIFGDEAHHNPLHLTVIRQQLTRQLVTLFPDVRDEISTAFQELIPAKENEWTPINATSVIRQIVARASNRVFVGVPLCRDPGYLDLTVNFAVDSGVKYLGKMIAERTQNMEEYGADWSERPNDLLQWLIETASKSGKLRASFIVRLMMIVNFAAIHTSSNSFLHALYHLAADPELMQPLREEIDAVIKEDGWTKAAMGKMRKLDSFMRESQRVNGINGVSVMRKALKDLHFSDGTRIPAGTVLVTAANATHLDEENFHNPDIFDPFRFSDMRDEDGESTKHQFVSTSVDYVAFGHGKHACPGRFFAANELKAMMAHVIVTYDVKFSNEGVRPANKWIATTIAPDPTATVLFRKRRA